MSRKVVFVAAVSLALGVILFLHTLLYSDGWRNRQRARADLETVAASNAATERRVNHLRAQIEAIRTRPDVQKRAVRHELGYTRAGEIVLELDAGR